MLKIETKFGKVEFEDGAVTAIAKLVALSFLGTTALCIGIHYTLKAIAYFG